MSDIVTALSGIATVVSGVTGIKKTDQPPVDVESEYPFSVVYFVSGNVAAAPVGTKKNLFNVAVEVLTKKIKLANDLALVNPFLDSVPLALIGEVSVGGGQFGHSIETFDNVTIEFLPDYPYNNVPMIGYRFIMNNVKILISL